jgi:mono/diheme cytochrome c family protein
MKKLVKRVLLGLSSVVVLAAAALAIVVMVRKDRRFEAPYPAIQASRDPAVIARGRYLVEGPAHCGDCHRDEDRREEHLAGAAVPFSGGHEWKLPVGTIRAANITSDPETGIGRLTDGEIARVLRHGVAPDGRAVLPFMPFADLSDEDLTAVISYLRTLPPVRKPVVRMELNALGVALKALVLEPKGPTRPVVATVAAGPTAEYGGYLANAVGNCVNCHTRMDQRTGEKIGPRFAGGHEFEHQGRKFVSPNLTPHATTGWIASWSEEDFVARFKSGSSMTGSPMPWRAFAHMSEDDLRAVYRYLRTLEPVENLVPTTVVQTVSMR